MVKVSIVIPIHNEEEILPELARRVDKIMKKYCKKDWECLLINDFSNDKSPKIMERLAKKFKNIKILHHKKQKRQTGCFQTGFDNAKGNYVITMDGDLQVFPEDLPSFIKKMDEGYDLVNGIRESKKDAFFLTFASRIYNILMLIFFNSPLMDNGSNYTAINRKFVKGIKLTDNDHRYLVPILRRRGLKKMGEVMIKHAERKAGKSKYGTFKKYIIGFPEIILASIRIKSGRYDLKNKKV